MDISPAIQPAVVPTAGLSASTTQSACPVCTARRKAKTAAEFDNELAASVQLLQDRLPNQASAARCIAAFVRGVLEGAGCALPWNLKKLKKHKT